MIEKFSEFQKQLRESAPVFLNDDWFENASDSEIVDRFLTNLRLKSRGTLRSDILNLMQPDEYSFDLTLSGSEDIEIHFAWNKGIANILVENPKKKDVILSVNDKMTLKEALEKLQNVLDVDLLESEGSMFESEYVENPKILTIIWNPSEKFDPINWYSKTKSFSIEDSSVGSLEITDSKYFVNSLFNVDKFQLKNKQTGNVILFGNVKKHYTKDEDHELTHWEYLSLKGAKFPVKFIVWND